MILDTNSHERRTTMNTKFAMQPPVESLTPWAMPESLIGVPPTIAESPEPEFARLVDAFEAHVAAEADSVASYRRLAHSSDPVVALLIGLVLEDEERHHALQQQIVTRLRDALRWTHSPDALPVDGQVTGDTAAAVEALLSFIQHEQQSASRFREMAERNADLYKGLVSVLLETMAADSEKHERLLRFILRRTLERAEQGA
jgi:rubrerythrin